MDDLARKLNVLGYAAKIFKGDISWAFSRPLDVDLIALAHKGSYYLDLALLFGFRLGSNFFHKTSNTVRFIINKHGFNALLNYIDDLLYFDLPSKISSKCCNPFLVTCCAVYHKVCQACKIFS